MEENQPTQDGWVSIHRKILDNAISSKPNYLSVFLYLILNANHKDKDIIWNNKKVTVKRGEFIGSISKISKFFNLSTASVVKIVKYLESEKMIERSSNYRFTYWKVLNYDAYQKSESKSESKVKAKRKQGKTTNNDNKENKKYNKHMSPHGDVPGKVKFINFKAKPSKDDDKFIWFVYLLNKASGKGHFHRTKLTLPQLKVKTDYKRFHRLLKEGFNLKDFNDAINKAVKDPHHRENDYKWLKPSLFLQEGKLDYFLNQESKNELYS